MPDDERLEARGPMATIWSLIILAFILSVLILLMIETAASGLRFLF